MIVHADFEHLVVEAIDALPAFVHDKLDNVEIVVEDLPDRETMRRAGIHHPYQLLGFYHGVPQTRRTRHYELVLPDKITLYRRPIERRCRTEEEMREMIYHVLIHEIAHHFGIDDDRLRELGAY
jgi:predicted Zn-dependent protease with MMP-like domain